MEERLFTRNFSFITAANFFFFLSYSSYQLLPLHIQSLGGGESIIGAVMGTASISALFLMPLVGIWIDRLGRKPFLLLGQALMGLGALGFLLAGSSFWLFALLRFVQGVGFACFFPASGALVADSAPKGQLARAFGVYGISGLITQAIAPATGELVIGLGGFSSLFVLTAVYGFLPLIFLVRIEEKARGEQKSLPLFQMISSRKLRPALLTTVLVGAAIGSVLIYVATFIRSRGVAWIGLFYIAYTVMAIFVRVFFGRVSDHFGYRRVILPALVGLAVALGLLSVSGSLLAFAFAGLLNGASHGFLYPALGAFAFSQMGAAHRGKVMALFATSFNVGMTVAAFGNGFVAEGLGYGSMYLLTGGLVLVGAAVFFWKERPGLAS